MPNDPKFELVDETPFCDKCGHYHKTSVKCPANRKCRSPLCCVPEGDVKYLKM